MIYASYKKIRPIACPIQKPPSSLEGLFPIKNFLDLSAIKHYLDADENNAENDLVRYSSLILVININY